MFEEAASVLKYRLCVCDIQTTMVTINHGPGTQSMGRELWLVSDGARTSQDNCSSPTIK